MVTDILIQIDNITIDTIITAAPPPRPAFRICIGPMVPYKEPSMPTEARMSSEMKALVTVAPITPAGNPAPLDGPAVFTIEGACLVEQATDDSAWVYGSGPGTDSVLTIKGDADIGAGVEPIADTVVFHIDHPKAASMGTTVGTPVLKDPGDPA
jgi:hypothetical protein